MPMTQDQVAVVSQLVSDTTVEALIADRDPVTKVMDKTITKTFKDKTYQAGDTVFIKIEDQPEMPVQQTQMRVDPVIQTQTSVTVLPWNTAYNLQTVFEELSLGGEEMVKKGVIRPRVETMAAQIATIAYTELLTCPGFVGTPGTAFQTALDFGKARAALRNQLFKGFIYCFMSPDDMANVSSNLADKFNPTSDASTAYLKGVVNNAAGIEFAESTLIPTHTNGSAVATGAAGMALSANVVSGSTTVSVSGGTANGIVTAGSLISFTGLVSVQPQTKMSLISETRTFTVAQTVQLSGSGVGDIVVTTPIYGPENTKLQNISALPTSSPTQYVGIKGGASKSYRQMIFMGKESSAMIGVSQAELIGGVLNGSSDYDGLPIQTAASGDVTNRQNSGRIDFLGAAKNLQYRWQYRAFTAEV